MQMKKTVGLILLLLGVAGLVLGTLGIFGQNYVAFSPWALAILGIIFFFAGVSLIKRIKA